MFLRAYHCGYTQSDAETYAGKYLDIHSYRPRMRERADGEWNGRDWFEWRNADKLLDSTFNPVGFGVAIAMDIGVAMRTVVKRLADPAKGHA